MQSSARKYNISIYDFLKNDGEKFITPVSYFIIAKLLNSFHAKYYIDFYLDDLCITSITNGRNLKFYLPVCDANARAAFQQSHLQLPLG